MQSQALVWREQVVAPDRAVKLAWQAGRWPGGRQVLLAGAGLVLEAR